MANKTGTDGMSAAGQIYKDGTGGTGTRGNTGGTGTKGPAK